MADDANNQDKTATSAPSDADIKKANKAAAKAEKSAEASRLEQEAAERDAIEARAKLEAQANAANGATNNDAPATDNAPTAPDLPKAVVSPEFPAVAGDPPAPTVTVMAGVPVPGSEAVEPVTTDNRPDLQADQPSGVQERVRKSDMQVLYDAMPDELWNAFVKGRNLNSRGVDEATGFDIRKVDNPTLDSIRINLRQQGYFV